MNDRLKYLDAYRGLAILLVVLFHAYTRWPEIVPYGDQYAFPFFKIGWVGVRLFFLISGFVILMTLERSTHFKDYLVRRWLRLFPAMLICSLLVFFSASFFFERPSGQPTFSSLLPGLTFTDIELWRLLFGFPENNLEGTFWSLYVEFKFYLFAALFYFWKGTHFLISALVTVFVSAIAITIINHNFPNEYSALIDKLVYISSFRYFGWFAAGASFYLFSKSMYKDGDDEKEIENSKEYKWLYIGLLIAIASSLSVKEFDLKPAFVATSMSLFFALSVLSTRLQTFLSNRIFLFFGFISYPFYLIHENTLISMIIKIHQADIGIPLFLLPVIPIIILSVLAWFISKYMEKYLKGLIIRWYFVLKRQIRGFKAYSLKSQ